MLTQQDAHRAMANETRYAKSGILFDAASNRKDQKEVFALLQKFGHLVNVDAICQCIGMARDRVVIALMALKQRGYVVSRRNGRTSKMVRTEKSEFRVNVYTMPTTWELSAEAREGTMPCP